MKIFKTIALALSLTLSSALAQAQPVLVFAASSLKNALDEVAAASGVETSISYAATSALAKQIQEGAPADVFMSADLDWMKKLDAAGLIKTDTQVELLGNTLVLVAPADDARTLELKAGMDLAGALAGGKLAMADVKSVPAGKYGKAALEALGVWASVEASVAQAENVRAALKLVALKEASLGIVYGSDANAEKTVKVLGTFPADSHPKIIYPVAVTTSSSNPDALKLLEALKSKDAQAIFAKHGFVPLLK